MKLPDFSGLTGALVGGGQSGGFNIPDIGLPSSSSSGSGGLFGGLASGAGLGASLGSIVPGVGTAVGGAIGATIGAISGLFSKPGVFDHERADLNTIARDNDITPDQASWVCGYEESHSPRNYDDICAQAARDSSWFQQLVVKYNASGTSTPVKTLTAVANEQAGPKYIQLQQQLSNSFAGTGTASPLAGISFNQVQADAKSQGMSLSDYLTAIINGAIAGAQQGAAGAAADTPAGQAATKDTISYLAKKYQLLIAAAIAGLIWLIVKALEKK